MASTHGAPAVSERIGVLDVLRGLALLGMYVVHFNYYEATLPGAAPSPMAAAVERVIRLFFEERFYAIFGMLFGVGFAVQLARADARGEAFTIRFLRRLAALAVIGFIAEGIFGYNVLFGYAVWGVPLLLVRRWPVRWLIVLALVCAASRQLYMLGQVAWLSREPTGMAQFDATRRADAQEFSVARAQTDSAELTGEWRKVVAARLKFMPVFHKTFGVWPSGSFTLFLLGLIAFRLRLFDRPEEHRRLIVGIMAFGVASWAVAASGALGDVNLSRAPVSLSDAATTLARFNLFNLLREQWLAFTYVGAILLLISYNRDWLQRFSPLALVGRMALTNYMMQVIMVDVLFTPHGFGLKVPAIMVPIGACLLLVAQVVIAKWWLARFRLGPLEWLWRMVTYWKYEPLRVAASAHGDPVVV